MGHALAVERTAGASGEQAATPISPAVLCDLYGDRVFKFASMVSRNEVEAEDVAQEALLRAVQGLRRFTGDTVSLEGWLWRIVVNVARTHGRLAFRRGELWRRVRGEARIETPMSPADMAIRMVADQELLTMVRALPPRSRTAIALRIGADLSYAQVAREMGVSVAAAKMSVQRGLNILRTRLAEDTRDG
ncbi:MAG: polymerase sigma-70 factor, subfamily [Chloroflexota bacterium]|jgi:RNA polymerase sigma-70 factor (ECF subfamily)|nr:polymerase sigma-70 factor, subfamily [Chloroflexota bacterium]